MAPLVILFCKLRLRFDQFLNVTSAIISSLRSCTGNANITGKSTEHIALTRINYINTGCVRKGNNSISETNPFLKKTCKTIYSFVVTFYVNIYVLPTTRAIIIAKIVYFDRLNVKGD